jgi:hypothetical protein
MGLRETLASRGLPVAEYPMRAVPSRELAEAEAELSLARADLATAERSRTVSTAQRRRVEEAEAAHRACFSWLTLRALPPAEMEALVGQHAPNAEDETRKLPFHQATLLPALLAMCVYDGPDEPEPALTEAEWAAQVAKGSGSLGEIGGLFAAVWQVNDRTPDGSIPKGLTRTRG